MVDHKAILQTAKAIANPTNVFPTAGSKTVAQAYIERERQIRDAIADILPLTDKKCNCEYGSCYHAGAEKALNILREKLGITEASD